MPTITREHFKAALSTTRLQHGRAVKAAYLVMVLGKSQAAAARLMGVDRAAVCRIVNRLTKLSVCQHCGRAG